VRIARCNARMHTHVRACTHTHMYTLHTHALTHARTHTHTHTHARSFVASLLTARDSMTVAYGVHASEVLMARLPSVFAPHFLKASGAGCLVPLCLRHTSCPS